MSADNNNNTAEFVLTQINSLSDGRLIELTGYYLTRTIGVTSEADAQVALKQYDLELELRENSLEQIRDEIAADRTSYRRLFLLLLEKAALTAEDDALFLKNCMNNLRETAVVPALLSAITALALIGAIQPVKSVKQGGAGNSIVIKVSPGGEVEVAAGGGKPVVLEASNPLGRFLKLLNARRD